LHAQEQIKTSVCKALLPGTRLPGVWKASGAERVFQTIIVGTLHAECSPLHAQEQIETSVCKASLPGVWKANGDERVFQTMIVDACTQFVHHCMRRSRLKRVCARLRCQAHASQESEEQVVLSESFKP
jgi:hypothetical protein